MNPEWLVTGVPLALVVILLLRVRGMGRVKLILLLVLAGFALGGGWAWSARLTRKDTARRQLADRIPSQGRPGGYVSSDRCQACHPGEYATWHRTYHRTMTQVASPQAVVGDFNDVALELEGKKYLLQRRGSEFWVEMEDPEWRPPTVATLGRAPLGNESRAPRVWRRIGLLTGSHHMQAYWVPSQRGKMQIIFPFAWLIADQRWVPFHQTFLRDPNKPPSQHIWNVNCITCHATGGQPMVDPQTHLMSTRAGELGISCEACHGPGEAHIAANQNPLRRYALHRTAEADDTIVNPKRLSSKLSSQVCGQCHGIKWIPASSKWREEGFQYRPGDELDQTTPIARPARLDLQPWLKAPLQQNPTFLDEHYWPDGMVRVSGRDFSGLVEAPCYQRGNLSCLSCHSMHDSDPVNQVARGMETNEACYQCHGEMRARLQEHTHHPPESSGSLCYNCHMPHTVYGLLKSIRSHQIDSPSAATTLATGRPNACNLCHLDRSLAWTADQLSIWYQQKRPSLPKEHEQISAALLNLLKGDAGQRALIANAMGWTPAREASGHDWLAPYLGVLLQDPYSAVRYIAHRSLRSLPGEYLSVPYDFVGAPTGWQQAGRQVAELWTRNGPPKRTGSELLIRTDGNLDETTIQLLLQNRDNRSMDLQE